MKINRWLATRHGQSIFALLIIMLVYCAIQLSPKLVIAPVLAGLVPVILYKGFFKPYIFCLGFFIFGVFRLHEVFPQMYAFKLPLIFSVLVSLSVFGNAFLNRIDLYWRREMTYFLIFFLFVTTGVLLAYDFNEAFQYWINVFSRIFIIFFMITWSFQNGREYSWLISVMISCGVIIAARTIYNKFNAIGLIEGTRVGLGGTFSMIGDPNDLACILLIPFGFACSVWFLKSNWIARTAGFISTISVFQAIVATQSRGGLLGLASIVIYFVSRRVKSIWPIIIICIVLPVFLYTVSHIGQRASGGAGQGLDDSFMGRIYAWQAAFNMALHHPIFGVGLNGFQTNYYTYHIFWDKTNHAVHSSWFGVLAESGFPGLFLFIFCIYLVVKSLRVNISKLETMDEAGMPEKSIYLILAHGIYASLIGFCVSSTFLTQGFTWPFYIIFALSISLTHNLEKWLTGQVPGVKH